MAQHPLTFFFNLVETDKLNAIKVEFYAGADEDSYDQTIDLEKESRRVTYSDRTNYGYETEYFTDYLAVVLQEQKSLAMQNLDFLIIAEAPTKRLDVCLIAVHSSLNLLIKKVKANKEFKRYPIVLKSYDSLREYIDSKAEAIKTPTKVVSQSSNGGLQWIGQENVLGTLFYDLLKGQDGGAPYINAKSIDIQRFIAKNFVGKEGGSVSLESLKTIFTPSKVKKRAMVGTRIELPNKKVRK